MKPNFKVAILSDTMAVNNPDILSSSTNIGHNIGFNMQHARPSGPYKINEIFKEHGYNSTVFNYFSYWDQDELLNTLKLYSEGYPLLIGFSMTLNTGSRYVSKLEKFVKELKDQIPGTITILGGVRHYEDFDKFNKIGDIVYFGRSTMLLTKSIHDRMFDNLIGKKFDPIEIRHPNNENALDNPVTHKFYSEDLWSETDVAMFETALGCKFDCTFCNFDFRGIKNPLVNNVDRLVEYFNNAKNNGVTHFFAADDTINESDNKINTLHTAVKELDFDIHICAYARLEMFGADESRIEKFSEIGLHSLNFGIETFNGEAGKLVRKGFGSKKIISTLKKIKNVNPNFFLYATMIAGLSKDNRDHIFKYTDIVLKDKILDCIQYIPLNIWDYNSHWDWQSHIDKDPEKFGYKIISKGKSVGSVGAPIVDWSNEWIDFSGAKKLAGELAGHIIKNYKISSMVSNWTYTCLKAGKAVTTPTNFPNDFYTNIGRTVKHTYNNTPIDKLIYNYISKKKNFYI